LVRYTPEPHRLLLGSFLALPGRQRLFGPDGAQPRYPALLGLIAAGQPLAKVTYTLGLIPEEDETRFLLPLRAALHGSGPDLHFRTLRVWLDAHPTGAARWLDRLREEALPVPLEEFSDDEIRWARNLIEDGELHTLWRFLMAHGTYGDLQQLLQELRTLSRTGALRQAFELLATFENPRLRELARVLAFWEASGELSAFLDSVGARLQSQP